MSGLTGLEALLQAVGVKASVRVILVCLVATLAAGCRQTDGVMPVADGEVPNRLSELSRDLLSVAARVPNAKQEFVADLGVFAEGQEAEEAVSAFAAHVGEAVEQASLTESSAQQLARALWIAVGATEMSGRQIEAAQNDLRTQLMAAGVPEERSEAVAAEVRDVQDVVTTRRREWFEFF